MDDRKNEDRKKENEVIDGAKKVKKITKTELTEKLGQRGILTSVTCKKEICIKTTFQQKNINKRLCQDGGGSKWVSCRVFGSMDVLKGQGKVNIL